MINQRSARLRADFRFMCTVFALNRHLLNPCSTQLLPPHPPSPSLLPPAVPQPRPHARKCPLTHVSRPFLSRSRGSGQCPPPCPYLEVTAASSARSCPVFCGGPEDICASLGSSHFPFTFAVLSYALLLFWSLRRSQGRFFSSERRRVTPLSLFGKKCLSLFLKIDIT